MRRWAKVIVGKDSSHRSIDAGIVHQRIQIPTLNRRLRAHPALALRPRGRRPIIWTGCAARIGRIRGTVKNVFRRQLRSQHLRRAADDQAAGVVDGPDCVLNFLWTERTVFIVEAVAGAV